MIASPRLRTLALAWLVALLCITPATAEGQSCTAATGMNAGSPGVCATALSFTATMTVVRVGSLALSGSTTITTPSGTDFENSETSLGSLYYSPTFTVKSNATYHVAITYGATWTSPSSKPVEQVAFQVADAGACNPTFNDTGYTPLSVGGATTTIVSGATSTASRSKVLCFKVKWLWATDGPGAYTLPITFSVTAP